MEPLEARQIATLPPAMQMVYWTGAAAQSDVALEHTLTGVYVRLATTERKRPRTVKDLSAAIRGWVEEGRISDPELSRLALALLDAIDQAHATRNRLVHDLWWSSPSSASATFEQLLLHDQAPQGPTVRHLDEFHDCATQLRICEFQATALGALLDEGERGATLQDDHAWWAALAGPVELTEGGGYRITRPSDT